MESTPSQSSPIAKKCFSALFSEKKPPGRHCKCFKNPNLSQANSQHADDCNTIGAKKKLGVFTIW